MLDLNIIDATAELRLLRFLDTYTQPFEVMGTYRLIDDGVRPEATVTLRAGDQEMHEADLGVGPVDALAKVLKKSLGQLFPDIPTVRLLDFKVRLIEGHIGTSSQIEVSIIFSDGKKLWKVSSVDDNVNLASFKALLDGYEYAIYLWSKNKVQSPGSRVQGKVKKQSPGSRVQSPEKGRKTRGQDTTKANVKAKPKGKTVGKTAPSAAVQTRSKTSKSKAKPKPKPDTKTKAGTKSKK